MHIGVKENISTLGDTQVPFESFQRLLKKAPSNVETFIRPGDFHFICDEHFLNPKLDKEYSEKIINFLKKNFDNEVIFSKMPN